MRFSATGAGFTAVSPELPHLRDTPIEKTECAIIRLTAGRGLSARMELARSDKSDMEGGNATPRITCRDNESPALRITRAALLSSSHSGSEYAERHETECRERGYLKKRSNSRVNDAELFTRLFYYGTAQLHLSSEEVWLMPFGFLMDLWECHKQFIGISKPKREANIDEVVPVGI